MRTSNQMWYRKFLTVLAMLVFAGATAVAEVPSAPSDVYANWSPDGQGGRNIDLVWMVSAYGHEQELDADGFYVYQSFDNSSFERVATVPVEDEYGFWGGYKQFTSVNTGTYTYYVTAYNEDGESTPSYQVSVAVPDVWVEFQGQLPVADMAEPEQEYTYTFTATASDGTSEVRYAVTEGYNQWGEPATATIDEVTGEFKTTLPEHGYYTFYVSACLANNPEIAAFTTLELKTSEEPGGPHEPKFCATISGTVTDVNSNPVKTGYMVAYSADEFQWFSTGAPVVDGSYELLVPEGSFYVMYHSERGDVYQFYPQGQTPDEATAVQVACDEAAVANLQLQYDYSNETTITVSGRVTRESDGSGVEAMVYFYDSNEFCGISQAVATDKDGYYEITLLTQYGPNTYSYTAMATPVVDMDLFYEYYPETLNPAEATVINESSDNVNFTLSGLPEFNGSISGTITDNENNLVEATVMAFSNSTVGGIFFPMNSFTETENGVYSLQNLPPGDYYLVVLPHTDCMPGYYAGNGQELTMNWDEAQVVVLNEGATLTGVDMIAPKIEAEGINVVEGQVSEVSGAIGKGDDVQNAEPVKGAMLYAVDNNGTVVGSTTSDNRGRFQLSGFGTGTYRIYADKLGYLAYEGSVTFDKAGDRHNVDVTLQTEVTTGVTDPVLTNADFATFPNPVTSQLSVRFNALASTVRISVSDITGKELIARDVQTAQGDNTVQLDLSNLSAGAYIVTLKAENSVLTAPVRVVR